MKTWIILFLTFSQLYSYAGKVITFGVTKQTFNSSQGQFSVKLYSEILKELDHELKIDILPPVRLAKQTAKGSTDGELIRMSNYTKLHPYLTRVEEPTFKFAIASYSTDKTLSITNWKDLNDLSIGHRKGMKVIEMEIRKRYPNKKIIENADPKKLLRLAAKGRIQAYLGVEYLTDEVLRTLPNISSKFHKKGILKRDSAHLFLSKKYSHLAPKISERLKAYKKNGKYRKLRQKPSVNN
jgi:ABC-type amino acid transport substrate-binding protein